MAKSYPITGQYSHFIPPENTRKNKGFLVFSWGVEWEHWPEIRLDLVALENCARMSNLDIVSLLTGNLSLR